MLIEYKIKFEKNGITITQQVGHGSSPPVAASRKAAATSASDVIQASSKELGAQFIPPAAVSSDTPETGGSNADLPATGEGDTSENGLGSGVTIVFGPTVIYRSAADPTGGSNADLPQTGEGNASKASNS